MGAKEAMLAGRRAAQNLMVDQVRVTRVTGGPFVDPMTGQDSPGESTTVYVGQAKLQGGAVAVEVTTVEHTVAVQSMQVHFPVGSYTPRVGDVVDVVSSGTDPSLAGLVFRVVQVAPFKTFGTAYRVGVEYLAGGAE